MTFATNGLLLWRSFAAGSFGLEWSGLMRNDFATDDFCYGCFRSGLL